MSKRALYLILIIDLLAIIVSIYVIFDELSARKNYQLFTQSKPNTSAVNPMPARKTINSAVESSAASNIPDEEGEDINLSGNASDVSVSTSAVKLTRNILFTYRNSKPSIVALTGEFNDWKQLPMAKDAGNLWSVTVELKPGEYLYGYVVDGKFITDPNNPKTRIGANAKKCSLITVKPL